MHARTYDCEAHLAKRFACRSLDEHSMLPQLSLEVCTAQVQGLGELDRPLTKPGRLTDTQATLICCCCCHHNISNTCKNVLHCEQGDVCMACTVPCTDQVTKGVLSPSAAAWLEEELIRSDTGELMTAHRSSRGGQGYSHSKQADQS